MDKIILISTQELEQSQVSSVNAVTRPSGSSYADSDLWGILTVSLQGPSLLRDR